MLLSARSPQSFVVVVRCQGMIPQVGRLHTDCPPDQVLRSIFGWRRLAAIVFWVDLLGTVLWVAAGADTIEVLERPCLGLDKFLGQVSTPEGAINGLEEPGIVYRGWREGIICAARPQWGVEMGPIARIDGLRTGGNVGTKCFRLGHRDPRRERIRESWAARTQLLEPGPARLWM